MTTYARVAVNVPSMTGVFDYSVPEPLAGQVRAGRLVTAPFGRQTVQAVVLQLVEQPSVEETKEIASLLDPEPVLTQAQIRLAEYVSKSTLTPMAQAVGLFLPPGLAREADVQYSVASALSTHAPSASLRGSSTDDVGDARDLLSKSTLARPISVQYSGGELGEVQKRVVRLLRERGPLRGRQIDYRLAGIDWRKAAQSLVKRGMLDSRPVLPPSRVRPKYVRTVQLAVTPEAANAAVAGLGNTAITQMRREKVLRYLSARPEAVNVSWVYAESGCNLADLQELAERQLITLMETEV